MGQLQAGLQALAADDGEGPIGGRSYIQGIGKQLNFLAGRFQLGGVGDERLSALMQIAHRRTMQSLKKNE